jgi:tetraacyldisaccharide-1-P 4'-kinase
VGLSNLVPAGEGDQLGFFSDPGVQETDRSRALNQAVDGLRERFGMDSVLPAGAVREEESARDGRETGAGPGEGVS